MPVEDKRSLDSSEESKKPRLNRRRFLRWGFGLTAAATATCAADGFLVEPRGIVVTRRTIGIKGLAKAWEGTTIAHISDIHAGEYTDLDDVREIVNMTNSLKPDIVAITGDFVSRADSISAAMVEVLRDLRPKIGSVAVLGNHDYWADGSEMKRALALAEIPLLTNTHLMIKKGKQKLCLAGVDDLQSGRPDVKSAMRSVPGNCPRILLCHNPDYAELLPKDVRVDLMLCGHTHGGQVKIPFAGPVVLRNRYHKYAEGLVPGPRCPVFVSRGLGMVTLPVRFNCRPEIPLLNLHRA